MYPLVFHRKFYIPVRVKNILIFSYLGLILVAGSPDFFNLGIKQYLYPWGSWRMFTYYVPYHTEISATFVYADGSKKHIPNDKIFPMDVIFIERGNGISLNDLVISRAREGKKEIAEKLCRYMDGRQDLKSLYGEKYIAILVGVRYRNFVDEKDSGEDILAECPVARN